MRTHVEGEYKLDLDATIDGQAPLTVATDTVRLTSSAEIASVRFFVPEALAFGPVVTNLAGNDLRGHRADNGKLRLQLDLAPWLRPATLHHQTDCHRARLGDVDYVPMDRPEGFDERRLVAGPGLASLYATPVAAEVSLQVDPTHEVIVKVRGDAKAERREVYVEGLGYRVRGWMAAARLKEVPEYVVGEIGTVGRGSGRGGKRPELILICPHELTLHATRGEVAFPAVTLKPGPEIRIDTRGESDGLQPIRVHDLPFSLAGGYALATKPDALEGCKPPRDR